MNINLNFVASFFCMIVTGTLLPHTIHELPQLDRPYIQVPVTGNKISVPVIKDGDIKAQKALIEQIVTYVKRQKTIGKTIKFVQIIGLLQKKLKSHL